MIEFDFNLALSEDDFWRLVDLLDWTGPETASTDRLINALSERSEREIRHFREWLGLKLRALDTYQFAEMYQKKFGGWSVDCFLYARCWIVAKGRENYEATMIDKSKFPDDLAFEELLYLHHKAYEKKTGEELDHFPLTNYESTSNAAGWPGVDWYENAFRHEFGTL